MIPAYHVIGTGASHSEDRTRLFDAILKEGVILPANQRLARAVMEERCFSKTKTRGMPLAGEFPDATGSAFQALKSLAREIVNTLPEEGSTDTKFTCLDLLAGDLNRVFLTVGRGWFGNIQNGFIFDAEELIRNGARVRDRDVLDDIHRAITKMMKRTYRSLPRAKSAIRGAIRAAVAAHVSSGSRALGDIEICLENPPCAAELTWNGPLPLDHAVEAWREGERIYQK